MSASQPTVSAIVIFKDEERFIEEAIDSVIEQRFEDWELLLVDDGSSDRSAELAQRAAATSPRIHYVDHPGHANLGMSASRNLGLKHATGTYVAFLDADDKWLPETLERRVADLEANPSAAMVFGPLLRWRTWSDEPDAADHEHLVGIGWSRFRTHPYAGQLVEAPKIVRLILKDDYFIPSGCVIRRAVLDEVGRFEDPFRGWHEDAVVMIKICLRYPVFVSPEVLYLYRLHPDSCTQQLDSETVAESRRHYYAWIENHFIEQGAYSLRMRLALKRGEFLNRHRERVVLGLLAALRSTGRALIPRQLRNRLRARWRDRTRASAPRS